MCSGRSFNHFNKVIIQYNLVLKRVPQMAVMRLDKKSAKEEEGEGAVR